MSESFSYTFDFQLNIKDAVSYVKFHAVKSPYFRHWFWLAWLGIPPLFAIIWLIINQMDATVVLFSLIIAYVFWLLLSPIYLFVYNQIIALLIKSTPLKYGIDMLQTLKINNGQIINRTDSDEIVLQWNEIERILSDKNYVYMYQNPKKAIVLPKSVFKDKADSDAFIQNVKEVHTAARKNPGGVA